MLSVIWTYWTVSLCHKHYVGHDCALVNVHLVLVMNETMGKNQTWWTRMTGQHWLKLRLDCTHVNKVLWRNGSCTLKGSFNKVQFICLLFWFWTPSFIFYSMFYCTLSKVLASICIKRWTFNSFQAWQYHVLFNISNKTIQPETKRFKQNCYLQLFSILVTVV